MLTQIIEMHERHVLASPRNVNSIKLSGRWSISGLDPGDIEVSAVLNYKEIVWGGCDVSISALRAGRPVNQARQSGAGSADSVNSEGGPSGPARLSHDNIITPLTFTLHTSSNTMQWLHKTSNH